MPPAENSVWEGVVMEFGGSAIYAVHYDPLASSIFSHGICVFDSFRKVLCAECSVLGEACGLVT